MKTLIFKYLNNRRKQKLKKFYERISRDTLGDDRKYILCALQYQPEKSTSPLGGIFVNQYLMIDLLSKNLPEGWKLLLRSTLVSLLTSIQDMEFSFGVKILSKN